jgi:hypothetical protein
MGILLGLRFLSVRLSVRSSDILLARFVRHLIGLISYWLDLSDVWLDGRAEGRWVLSHSHTHTQIKRWVLIHSHTQLGLVLEIFKECSQYHTQNVLNREDCLNLCKLLIEIFKECSQYHTQNVLNREDCLNLCKLLTWRVTLLFYWQTKVD